jgi:hypothetical protein
LNISGAVLSTNYSIDLLISLNRPVDDMFCNHLVDYILSVVGQLLQVTLVKLLLSAHYSSDLLPNAVQAGIECKLWTQGYSNGE